MASEREAGRAAFDAGVPVRDNPHAAGDDVQTMRTLNEQGREWAAGWTEGYYERQGKGGRG